VTATRLRPSQWAAVRKTRGAISVPEHNTRSGSPAELAEIFHGIKKLGVQHCGVRFRSRSCDELIEQIHAFGDEVAPLINA
jgi:hypothetical protein